MVAEHGLVLDGGEGGVVDEPVDFFAETGVDLGRWEGLVAVVEDLVHDGLLGGALCDEGDVAGVCDRGEGEGDAVCRGFGRVGAPGDLLGGFVEQGAVLWAGEQRAGVAVRAAAQQQQVEARGGQQRLVLGRDLGVVVLALVDQRLVDRVDRGAQVQVVAAVRQRVQHRPLERAVVAVGVVQRHQPLVAEVDVPAGPLHARRQLRVLHEAAPQHVDQRSPADRHRELRLAVALQGLVLALQDV